MMKVSDFVSYLSTKYPTVKFYNGVINRADKQCVGVYARGSAPKHMALGGKEYTSYGVLPVTLLVHWSENSDSCETKANELFEHLFYLSGVQMGTGKLIYTHLLDSSPINIGRDDNNIAEMTIRAHLFYER